MRRTFRYPLHPTSEQDQVLTEWLDFCQQLYNAALQERRDAWAHEKRQRQLAEDRGIDRKPRRGVSYNDQTKELTELRGESRTIPVEVARSPLRRVNQRLDHARKLAAVLVAKYDSIAYEDLNIRGMVHGNLAKSIHDAAWGSFIHALTCKAEEAGKWCVPVDPRGTTQRCSACGQTVAKTIKDRVHICPCGLTLGRDENAAKNVLALGRSAVAGIA